jgi:hypothetical protein
MGIWKPREICSQWRGGAAVIHREASRITAVDLYRFTILGLMGVFYGFLIVLFFL